MLNVTCGGQYAEPGIPIGCRAGVVESSLRWGERGVKRQSNGMSTAGASAPKGPRSRDRLAEAHLGDQNKIGLAPQAKACADPPGSGSGTRLGSPPRDRPQRCASTRIASASQEGARRENPLRATPSMRSFKAHGRIGRPDSATSTTVTDSVADQDPEVE
jgi:hypothetical protein